MHSSDLSDVALKEVFELYGFEDSRYFARKITTGHIHETFILIDHNSAPVYILQKINQYVFQNISELISNISGVNQHFIDKFGKDLKNYPLQIPVLTPTLAGNLFTKTSDGNYWRCSQYIPHVEKVPINKKTAQEMGKAIGRFHVIMADFQGEMFETIPDFHHLTRRMAQLKKAIKDNPANRVSQVNWLLKEIFIRESELLRIDQLIIRGTFPNRTIHNDAKLDNILFDERFDAIGIIDLDTVMKGTVLYDFGDAVRALCNTTREDDDNTERIRFDLERFENFLSGYLDGINYLLQPIEMEYFATSCRFMTYIMAVRFLTDYLLGDVYYRITYPIHNLHRAANQITLLKTMETCFLEMQLLVKNQLSNY